MSIVRVGLGEEKTFAAGYEAIFGKTTKASKKPAAVAAKTPAPKAKKAAAKPAPKAKKPAAKPKKK